jgi:predicted transcriptional regulator
MTITVTIPDDRLSKLREIADRFKITPEDLVRVSIEEILTRPDEAFQQAARHVLDKNSELYRRLA